MITTIAFTPSVAAPFQFQATLDGATYNVVVTWLLFGQRWYVNIYDQSNTLIVALPLIGSPVGVTISTLLWSGGSVVASCIAPHGWPLNATISVTVVGASPDAYNGVFVATITGENTFTYSLTTYPGINVTPGSAQYNISMTAGYFASTLIYREQTQMFEVNS